MLDLLGLDQTAEDVYRAMLSSPEGGVRAIAERSGLSDAQVTSALDRLSALALLHPSYEVPGELRPVSPEAAMEILLARQQAELAERQQRLERSRAAAALLVAEYAELRRPAPQPGAELLVGLDQVRVRLADLARHVESEVMSFAPGGPQTAENMEAAKPLDEQMLARGVLMRTVYLDSVRNNQPTVAYADWFAGRGGQVRTAPSLPVRMVIVDRRIAVVANEGDGGGSSDTGSGGGNGGGNGNSNGSPHGSEDTGAVVLHGNGIARALCALFETAWCRATPLGRAVPRDERGITPQQSEVLRLLGRGLTDEATANRLGVAPRTARRIAAELMERLGARSRFQAGVHAERRGWMQS